MHVPSIDVQHSRNKQLTLPFRVESKESIIAWRAFCLLSEVDRIAMRIASPSYRGLRFFGAARRRVFVRGEKVHSSIPRVCIDFCRFSSYADAVL